MSLSRWLGRQIGHIRRAMQADPSRKVLYTKKSVQLHQVEPNLLLKRTTTDEVYSIKSEE